MTSSSFSGKIETLKGDRVNFYETSLYEYPDEFSGSLGTKELPVGPEPNDFISNEALDVSHTLTGDALVEFLKKFKKP